VNHIFENVDVPKSKFKLVVSLYSPKIYNIICSIGFSVNYAWANLQIVNFVIDINFTTIFK